LTGLKKDDCKNGWLLDGFPRNPEQAVALEKALEEAGIVLDYIIELSLTEKTARKRIMGGDYARMIIIIPNNIYIDEIKPARKKWTSLFVGLWCKLSTRADDQDEAAINKRHDIYYDSVNGTMAAVNYFKRIAAQKGMKFIELDGTPSVKSVTENMEKALQ
jgi:adenylate kinase